MKKLQIQAKLFKERCGTRPDDKFLKRILWNIMDKTSFVCANQTGLAKPELGFKAVCKFIDDR